MPVRCVLDQRGRISAEVNPYYAIRLDWYGTVAIVRAHAGSVEG